MIDFDEVTLTSQQILDRISEKEIYEYYLNDKVKDKLIKCCFHKDSNPSMGFYRTSSNSLNFKCFGCGESGSVFDFVAKLNNISFGQAVNLINRTFKLSKNYGKEPKKIYIQQSILPTEQYDEKRSSKILPVFRNFSKIDYNYWNQYYISLELLVKYNIKPCKTVYYKKNDEYLIFAEYSDDNPIYCYSISDAVKIYRPYAPKKSKWLSTTTNFDIQGLEQLPEKGELLIITSSMKDVLVLNIMGYNAIALGGEGNHIPDSILDYLWASFDNIIVFYDNDKPGLKYGLKFSEEIGAGNIYIPIEYTNTKDISDYVKEYNLEQGIKLMKQLL